MSSDRGKAITRLCVFDGHLYPAFGDYDLNLGPLDVVSVDLATQELGAVEVTLLTEQIWTFREIDGALYVPYLDPRDTNEHPDRGQYAVATAAGGWTVVESVLGLTHGMDISHTADGWWIAGTDETPPTSHAVIWHSADDQATWTEVVALPGGGFPRFYAFAQFGDDLLAFHNDPDGIITDNRVYLWAAGEWADVTPEPQTPVLTETVGPFSHDGTAFYLGLGRGKDEGLPAVNSLGGLTQKLHVIVHPDDQAEHDTIVATLPTNGIYDATVADGYLWTLTDSGDVLRGDTAGNWTAACTLDDDTVRSIAVDPDGGYLYFGTTDSRIVRTPIPT